MSTAVKNKPPGTHPPQAAEKQASKGRRRASTHVLSLLAQGEPFIWLTGGALVLCLLMILGLLALIAVLGLGTFTASPIVQVKLKDGRVLMGEVAKSEHFELTAERILGEPPEIRDPLIDALLADASSGEDLLRCLEQLEQTLATEWDSLGPRLQAARSRESHLTADAHKVPRDAFARSDMIRRFGGQEELTKARHTLTTLEGREQSIVSQLESVRMAKDRVTNLDRCDRDAILETPYESQLAILQALLTRGSSEPPPVRRRMLRTGNFELTGEHFNWVADYQIAEDGESQPTQAVVIERMTWGRFYGTPAGFQLTTHCEIPASETQLERAIDFLVQHADRVTEDDQDEFRAQLDRLNKELDQQRQNRSSEFLRREQSSVPRGNDLQAAELRVVTSTQEQKSADEVTAEDNVVAVVHVWNHGDAAWNHFTEHHRDVISRVHDLRKLEKHDLGSEFARQEHARLNVRKAELDHQLTILEATQQAYQAESERARIERELANTKAVVAEIGRRCGTESAAGRVAHAALTSLSTDAQQQLQQLDQTRKTWDAQCRPLPGEVREAVEDYFVEQQSAGERSQIIQQQISTLRRENDRYSLHMRTCDGQEVELAVADIVRAYQANRTNSVERGKIYLSRWWEFLTDEPREANSEGGVFPAIWGTVTMTLLMSLAVVPFGVLAALYLREYAKSGPIVSTIRIAINNLAGVPSIVFGVFGLGFFCYVVGAYLDGGPANARFIPLPPARWYVAMGLLSTCSLIAFTTGIVSWTGRHADRSTWRRLLGSASILLWLVTLSLLVYLLIKSPFFHGFYSANLPNPYWGKGGVLWAALTLALMTLPVVIVATEEALSAVPNSMREGSYGCGASKWQTIRRVVLPQALPGIMTGMILAMARGAGEVAPLMLVGAVKLAPELPFDSSFPFLHGNRSFMHLGFHIFDVGFQSQNSEAAKPMVYTTTLLLIAIITLLNVVAVRLRSYLRKRFTAGQF